MNLTSWSPLRELDDFFSGYRGLLNRYRDAAGDLQLEGADLHWRPVADISETDGEYIVRAELPDVKREDIKVSIEESVLKIEGERKFEKRSSDEKQHLTESFYGKFHRAFTLPRNANTGAISAESRDGVLTVRIPKKEQQSAQSLQIDVQ